MGVNISDIKYQSDSSRKPDFDWVSVLLIFIAIGIIVGAIFFIFQFRESTASRLIESDSMISAIIVENNGDKTETIYLGFYNPGRDKLAFIAIPARTRLKVDYEDRPANDIIRNVYFRGGIPVVKKTIEKFTAAWRVDLVAATAVAIELHFGLSGDGNSGVQTNEFWLYRLAASDEWTFKGMGDGGTAYLKTTTDFAGDTDPHNYKLIVDATVSPWDVSLSVDGVSLTWGVWDGNPIAAVFASPIYYGEAGNLEPKAWLTDLLIWETIINQSNTYNSRDKRTGGITR